ncbi:hypothetical protein [Methylobacterium aerolatum]|uniref:WD40 repeat domain-containing protein n=1 Tax=Methylobacterium aerolatum TaxID=418708 RepID=A0ABU0I624_9HYPH|nr:hypothetical protein [Methylobacterium aerolatum]MDQ0449473.1 hypothetical protein [Methylobacterium aerolatum]GJD33504.1 hypothetical protein FMGBMHLM_0392 [Methylobacterium aerolatum]
MSDAPGFGRRAVIARGSRSAPRSAGRDRAVRDGRPRPSNRWGVVLAVAAALALPMGSARAEPALRLLDLPFKVREMRGPRSELAVAVATSGLLPLVRRNEAGREGGREASGSGTPIAVVWGDEGGAILLVENGSVAVKPVGREAVEDLVASETPKGALPGVRRALDGPLSAFLTGRTRAPDGSPAAATLALRERQPLGVTSEPKPVPVATTDLPPGDGAVFAPQAPRIVPVAGRPAILAATVAGAGTGSLVLITRSGSSPAPWSVTARSAPGPRPSLAAVGAFSGADPSEAATVDAKGTLRLWRLAPDAITPGPEAAGFLPGEGDAALADVVQAGHGTELAVPLAGASALVLMSAQGGALTERLRIALPAPAGSGIASLGEGAASRLVVGLSDGRIAAIALDGGRP